METHGTYYNPNDELSDETMLIRMNYGARNQLGGMVRKDAFGEINIHTFQVTIIDSGF